MKPIKIWTILILTFLSTSLQLKAQNWDPATDPNFRLAWQDDFDSLAPNKWQKAHQFDHYGEPQVYMKSNVKVANGELI